MQIKRLGDKQIVFKKYRAQETCCQSVTVTLYVPFVDGQRSSGRNEGSSAGPTIPRVLWNSNVHRRVHNSPPHLFTLSPTNPVHMLH